MNWHFLIALIITGVIIWSGDSDLIKYVRRAQQWWHQGTVVRQFGQSHPILVFDYETERYAAMPICPNTTTSVFVVAYWVEGLVLWNWIIPSSVWHEMLAWARSDQPKMHRAMQRRFGTENVREHPSEFVQTCVRQHVTTLADATALAI